MADTAGGDVKRWARSELGTVIKGKYRLDDVIGVGGMAVVFRATHRNQAEFAVKMLLPTTVRDSTVIELPPPKFA